MVFGIITRKGATFITLGIMADNFGKFVFRSMEADH